MPKYFAIGLLLTGLLTAGGCGKVDVTVPDYAFNSSPPPPGNVAPANPSDRADVLRENQQLRQRVAWLEQDNARLQKKSRDLKKDQAEIQSDIDKAAAERDRYRRALDK